MDSKSPVHSQHHLVPVKTYALTFFALLVLMAATVAASYWQITPLANNLIALSIATVKAVLVIAVFMGVFYSSKLTKLWAMAGFIWATLIFGILIDYATRGNEVVPGMYHDQGSALPRTKDSQYGFTPGAGSIPH